MLNIIRRLFPQDSSSAPIISIIGLDFAGKTTLVYKLASSEVITNIPFISLAIENAKIQIQSPAGKKLRFTAKAGDTGGCSKYGHLVERYMVDDTSAIVWVIDANDRDRLIESPYEFRILFPELKGTDKDVARSIPFLILVSKTDLPTAMSLDTIREAFGDSLTGRRFAFFETSITNSSIASSGLPEAFAWLSDAITSTSVPGDGKTAEPKEKKPVEAVLADMRSPAALSSKLEKWLVNAENDWSVEELLSQFYALDLLEWNHYTHLRLAFVLLLKFGRRKGKDEIFEGFKKYIDKSGKVHGRSFHVTMTYFWIQMVHVGIVNMGKDEYIRALESSQSMDRTDIVLDDFASFLVVNSFIVDGQLWSNYYSKEILMSKGAKEAFRLPDVQPLPSIIPKAQFMSKK